MAEEKDLIENEMEMSDVDASSEADMNMEESLEEALKAEFGDEYVTTESSIFLSEGEEESESFLPEVEESEEAEEALEAAVDLEGTELDSFEAAEIEEVEFVEEERLESIVESILFASDRPVSLTQIKEVFKGTNIDTRKIRRALDQLMVEYAGGRRGVTLEEVPGGYQLRTKVDNLEWLRRSLKTRQFKLSGPALETLAIVAYKQPIVKAEVDEIRGVESGHLLRALMEKNLVNFQGKSELPGRPMQYGTTRKFLEIFGLRNLKELPTLSQIDEILPEGIGEEPEEKPTLSMITDSLSEQVSTVSYSAGEDELAKIEEQLGDIATSSDFFEQEKKRQAEKRNQERAQNIREGLSLGEPVSTRDQNWLKKYDEALAAGMTLVEFEEKQKAEKMAQLQNKKNPQSEETSSEGVETADSTNDEALEEAIANFDSDADLDIASSDDSVMDQEAFSDEEDEDDELPFIAEADDLDEEGDAHT